MSTKFREELVPLGKGRKEQAELSAELTGREGDQRGDRRGHWRLHVEQDVSSSGKCRDLFRSSSSFFPCQIGHASRKVQKHEVQPNELLYTSSL